MTFCAQKEAFHAQIVRLKAIRVIMFFGGDRYEIGNHSERLFPSLWRAGRVLR